MSKWDFKAWATKNDLVCGDGRVIRRDAFKDQDGAQVPLVWQHQHNDPENVLGYAILKNHPEGVRMNARFNDTKKGQIAKMLVEHGDINAVSIWANHLKQNGSDVVHGKIREVSLVLAPGNPGALIDSPIAHEDGSVIDEARIFTDELIELYHDDATEEEETVEHTDEKETPVAHADEEEKPVENNDKSVKDVLDTLNEEQKNVVCYLLAMANADKSDENVAEHSDDIEEEDNMKKNAFDNEMVSANVLSHDDIVNIFKEAKRVGSLKEAVENFQSDHLEHADNLTDLGYTPGSDPAPYGIGNIDYLFPEAKNLTNQPELIKRNDEWVSDFLGNVHRSPFSRIKSLFANITAAEARAKGYTKGNKKIEEVFGLLKRTTTPTTIYKKQKLDRDDLIDIDNSFNTVAFMKSEMRMMLDEEIARAGLVGDGRSAASDDKINEQNIRPIWTDDDFFTIKATVEVPVGGDESARAKAIIRKAIKVRKDYKGSGNATMYTTDDVLTDMLLLEDNNGRIIYDSVDKLATALRVKKISTVPVMEGLVRTDDDGAKHDLIAIIVNPSDYNIGADKGGAVSMFEDFDIDYNQEKYLIETRCSGALTKYHSAIVLEEDHVDEEDDD